jgi:hypothetical protein
MCICNNIFIVHSLKTGSPRRFRSGVASCVINLYKVEEFYFIYFQVTISDLQYSGTLLSNVTPGGTSHNTMSTRWPCKDLTNKQTMHGYKRAVVAYAP